MFSGGGRRMKLPSPEKENEVEHGLPEPNSLFPQYSASLPQFENANMQVGRREEEEEEVEERVDFTTTMSDGTPMVFFSTTTAATARTTTPRFVSPDDANKQFPLYVQTDETVDEEEEISYQHPSDFPCMSPPRKPFVLPGNYFVQHYGNNNNNIIYDEKKMDHDDNDNRNPRAKYRLWFLLLTLLALLLMIIILPIQATKGGSKNSKDATASSSTTTSNNNFDDDRGIFSPIPPELDVTATPSTSSPVVNIPTIAPTMEPTSLEPTVYVPPPTIGPTTVPPTISRNHPLVGDLYQVTPMEILLNPFTPQGQALIWMADTDKQEPNNEERIKQRYAMTVLDVALHSPEPRLWSSRNLHECNWPGVFCNENRHVTEINWARQSLPGKIPQEIGLLTHLEKLDIAQNQLQGTLDPIYDLEKLRYAYLFENRLTGTLSSDIENCRNLTRLFIGHNQLTGTIPPLDMRPLQWFVLHFNRFTGTISDEMRLDLTVVFDVSWNQLEGTIPENFPYEVVPNVRHVHMDHNKLSGTIPGSFRELGKGRLRQLYLQNNQLGGAFPADWLQVKFLNNIDISNNNFKNKLDAMCEMAVFEYGELVELRADCDICNCDRLCRTCRDDKDFKYEYDDDDWQFDDDTL